jgi:hypothetical protein
MSKQNVETFINSLILDTYESVTKSESEKVKSLLLSDIISITFDILLGTELVCSEHPWYRYTNTLEGETMVQFGRSGNLILMSDKNWEKMKSIKH